MLTTERMAEIAKLAIRLQQISRCAAVTSSGETVLHHTHVDEILSALHDVTAELLANREAQPVASREHFESLCKQFWNWAEFDEINTEEEPRLKWDVKKYSHRVTAALWRIYQAAPPAPAVTGDLLEAMAEVIRISDRDHEAWGRAKAAISAYRGAILDGSGILWSGFDPAKDSSDAIPDGWKLVPVELTKEMQDAWDSAPVSSDDDTVNMMNAYRAMLAAAPEGGN
ncbi:hypothetical protein JKX24_24820 [Serratia proteamaculans]|uniref:Uncharacterized protein n=1 Tax=Serratia proteamaculans TaxID=28151 RepID=A0A7U0N6C9_SERPR|nr:hypothetical protein [Serratia proteamaculans]MBO1505643.1 hypothetical protein [Serratia proteamaculans]QQX53335.1 hypothetical protein JKX24_24820 [Serratia proteamaculans]